MGRRAWAAGMVLTSFFGLAAAGATTSTLPPVPAVQTTVLPSSATPAFAQRMEHLWRAIVLGRPALALSAFFPESAYVRLKAIEYPAADFEHRLVHDFDLDILAAHRHLGAARSAARLVGVRVPVGEAAWIPPGYCDNSIGYWHDPGGRLAYDVRGRLRSIGVASFISWHGQWYVVHLGAVLRSVDAGIVDSPATGWGSPAPPGGC